MGGSSKYQAGNKYSKLENDMEKSNQKFIDDSQQQQQVCGKVPVCRLFNSCHRTSSCLAPQHLHLNAFFPFF